METIPMRLHHLLVPVAALLAVARPDRADAQAPAPAPAGATPRPAPAYKREVPPALAAQAAITEDSARTIAQRRMPHGRIVALELEKEKGKLIYSFDLTIAGESGIEEVNVDAANGSIVAVVHEK
jgi:uncharacterized membrane protein YkoI